jgi:murein DD-endopeptidase MepM/ murein hydrolase activator NlpD
MHGLVLAVVAVAGISVFLRGGQGPSPLLGQGVGETSTEPGSVLVASTESPTFIRGSAGLAQVAASLGGRTVVAPSAAPQRAALAAGHQDTPQAQAAATATAAAARPLDLGETGLQGSVAASAADQPKPEPTEILIVHEVRPGETLSTIGQRYGVSVSSLLANNAVIVDPDMLKIGLQVMVPTKDGVLYFVRLGDTIIDIADEHGVKPEDIVKFAPNKLTDANSIREGELILIPGGRRPAPPPPPTPAPAPAQQRPPANVAAAPPAPAPAANAARPVAGSGWIWPITGPLSSYFGPRHPLGIDVDLYGRAGAPIVAARGGTVTFAGGNPCCSYGYYVEINHGDGFTTLYAHLNAPPPVRIGQTVNQGQVIGYAGSTGYSTGVHLHFEIRKGGVYLNPLSYLP